MTLRGWKEFGSLNHHLYGKVYRKGTQSMLDCDLSKEWTLVSSHRDSRIFVIAANINYPAQCTNTVSFNPYYHLVRLTSLSVFYRWEVRDYVTCLRYSASEWQSWENTQLKSVWLQSTCFYHHINNALPNLGRVLGKDKSLVSWEREREWGWGRKNSSELSVLGKGNVVSPWEYVGRAG